MKRGKIVKQIENIKKNLFKNLIIGVCNRFGVSKRLSDVENATENNRQFIWFSFLKKCACSNNFLLFQMVNHFLIPLRYSFSKLCHNDLLTAMSPTFINTLGYYYHLLIISRLWILFCQRAGGSLMVMVMVAKRKPYDAIKFY